MTEPGLDVDGPAALPRRNGELAFDAPWQSRLFGVTAALVEAGSLDWPSFQQALIERIARPDAPGYWDSWAGALGDRCHDRLLVSDEDWKRRTDELAARPPDHDHRGRPGAAAPGATPG